MEDQALVLVMRTNIILVERGYIVPTQYYKNIIALYTPNATMNKIHGPTTYNCYFNIITRCSKTVVNCEK